MKDGDNGDVACDHYRLWKSDVELMRELGLTAYRFSVSWSRVLPEGTGRVNRAGLDFYSRLVDALLEAGIRPFATLYHWDLPAALDDRGGWLNRDVAEWFADYADVAFRALDDRVEAWATLNEPWVVSDGGYLAGKLAPGRAAAFEAPLVSHNLLRAHAEAVRAYRAEGENAIGLVVNLEPKYPASRRPEDAAATARADAYMNRQYLDPSSSAATPTSFPRSTRMPGPVFRIRTSTRSARRSIFLGINYYTRSVTRADPSAYRFLAPPEYRRTCHTHTQRKWEVYPDGLTDTLLAVKARYGDIPLYVTENGAAFYDPPTADGGTLDDPLRVDYLREHLRAARKALEKGVDLRGYFVWSLLDNFEWSHGFSKRFGIVHVDYATQKRTPKASARFYSEVIRTAGAALESVPSLVPSRWFPVRVPRERITTSAGTERTFTSPSRHGAGAPLIVASQSPRAAARLGTMPPRGRAIPPSIETRSPSASFRIAYVSGP